MSDNVACKEFIIQYGVHGRNLDIDKILYSLDNWESEDYVYIQSKFHMK